MCGICGQFNYQSGRPVELPLIQAMARSIEHRGPDDEGYFLEDSLGLGFRRLSIIDLSGGHQPMSDQEQTVWVVFNGEIYNFRALRAYLEKRGHRFQTNSDTEVIVHGYKEWGVDVLQHLNGMFGFALWDVKEKQLLVARDPMGIKVIYYTIDGSSLYFGSEIRPLLQIPGKKFPVDPQALNLFLRYRYTPAPLTIYQGIRKLPAGSCMVVRDGQIRILPWSKKPLDPLEHAPKDEDLFEAVQAQYEAAVERQLISDVPVGLLLSGGLDSGLLLALMNRCGASRSTYTVGFGRDFHDDELADAQETSRHFQSPNHSVRLDRQTFEDSLSKVVSVLEEPIASPSVVGMYHVCQRARQDVKVLLMGQGPDELIGGYKRHLGIAYGEYWRSMPGWLKTPLKGVLGALPRNETIKRSLYSLDVPDRLRRYQQVFSILPEDRIDSLFRDGSIPQHCGDHIFECWKDLIPGVEAKDELGGFQYLEVRSSLPDELLMYADKISMAHSLEVRVPYLDLEVVDYIERLPARCKIRKGQRKWLHKQVCKRYLPEAFLRRKKKGFAVNVVDTWYRDSMQGKIKTHLLDESSAMYDILRQETVRQLVADHISGRQDNHKILYSLVVFEEWMRQYSR